MSDIPSDPAGDQRPRLRLVHPVGQPDESGEEEPLTAEMIESLLRVRRRLQELLFPVRFGWSGTFSGY